MRLLAFLFSSILVVLTVSNVWTADAALVEFKDNNNFASAIQVFYSMALAVVTSLYSVMFFLLWYFADKPTNVKKEESLTIE